MSEKAKLVNPEALEAKKINRYRKVCKYCGSEEVVADATVEWNFEEQKWEIRNIFPDSYCNDCDEETTIIDKKV